MFKCYLLVIFLFGLTACSGPESEENQKPEPTVEKIKPLNLELPKNKKLEKDINIDLSKPEVLPNLFEKKSKKENKISVGGKLLRDEKNLDYIDSLHGAEVSAEIKLP